MQPDWPRPLALLAACLRQDDDGATARDLARAMTRDDWHRLAWLAQERHRIAPLVQRALGALNPPDEVAEGMARHGARNAMRALGQIAETNRVITALAPVHPVIFKGWPLSERLFGAPALRHAGDLDIAVAPDRMDAACTALDGLGYAADDQHGRMDRLRQTGGVAALADEGKDIRFVHPDGHVAELHWHLLPYRGWPDVLALPGAVETQNSQAGPLNVLSDQANMMYLPVHGGLHLWTRLKWLADIAPLATRRGPEGLAADMELAREIGLATPVAIGLKMSARLLGSPLPPGMVLQPPCPIERFMLDTIARDDMIPVISRRYRFWTRINALRLASGPRQILGVLRYDTLRRLRFRLAG